MSTATATPRGQPPRITVAAIIEQSGQFLFVEERVDGQGQVVNQPAGHVEAGEELLAAVRREVLEETAHDFAPQGLVGIYHYRSPGTHYDYVRFCFHGQAGVHYPERPLDPDILRTLWLDREALRGYPARSPMVGHCLDDYLAGQSWPLELLHYLPEDSDV